MHGDKEEGLRREVQLKRHRQFTRDVQAHGRSEEWLRGEHSAIRLPKLRSIRVRLRLQIKISKARVRLILKANGDVNNITAERERGLEAETINGESCL